MDNNNDEWIRSGKALSESMGNFHVTGWDAASKVLSAAFTVRRAYCHTNGTIAQGGFITAWLDAAMAHAVIHDTERKLTVFSLEIKVSFYEKVGPGEGRVEAPRSALTGRVAQPGRIGPALKRAQRLGVGRLPLCGQVRQ